MEQLEKSQIILHIEKSVHYSLFDTKWIPCSAKFVVTGSKPRGTGIIQIYEISDGELNLIKNVERPNAIKCGTFKASSLRDRNFSTGDFRGKLNIYDLENPSLPICTVDAHKEIINSIDGIGGQSFGFGAPELITGSRDGSVKVWDPRQNDQPVAVMEPKEGETRRDCWAVAFGNSYNSEERVVVSGYDNGDIKMFDLKTMSLRWESNVKNGVCSLEFDRSDNLMNKLVATTLESKFYVFDLRTQHPKKGFAYLCQKKNDKDNSQQISDEDSKGDSKQENRTRYNDKFIGQRMRKKIMDLPKMEDIVKDCSEGRLLLKTYKKIGTLARNGRRALVESITSYLLNCVEGLTNQLYGWFGIYLKIEMYSQPAEEVVPFAYGNTIIQIKGEKRVQGRWTMEFLAQ